MVQLLRKVDFRAFARFLAGGAVSSVVTLGTAAFLHEIVAISESVAAAIGLATALVVNFVVLRFYVFRGTRRPLGRQLLMFLGSSGVMRGFEYAGFFVVHRLGVHYLLALVLVQGVSFFVKFFVFEKLVFARKAAEQAMKTPLS